MFAPSLWILLSFPACSTYVLTTADESFPTTDDPEILALLDFAPVERRNKRHDGWSPDHQRGYIIGLALIGNVDKAAHQVGRTQSGAWTVRNSAGAEGFGKAWDDAIALYHRRNPRRGPPPPLPAPARQAAAATPADDTRAEPDEDARFDDFAERILVPYMMKLGQERAARLAGRIVEADFYVRQLTWLEVALDLGGGGVAALKALKRGDHHAGEIVATPMSVLLGEVRRAVWAKMDEPERPPPPPLGEHDEEVSIGEPWWYSHERDGPEKEWRRRRDEDEQLAAEAQRLWEEKARKDAAEWRARVEGLGNSPGFPGEGDHPQDGGGATRDPAAEADPEPEPDARP
jgi:hypothetical protein